ncbi:MAG: NTP transferase domain-containing protein [Candidatus Bathyarchaeia archaeon]
MSRFVELVILVGGGSTRVGRSKALLPVDGIPVIKRVVKAASFVSYKVSAVLKSWDDGGIEGVLKGSHVRFVFENYIIKGVDELKGA